MILAALLRITMFCANTREPTWEPGLTPHDLTIEGHGRFTSYVTTVPSLREATLPIECPEMAIQVETIEPPCSCPFLTPKPPAGRRGE